MELFNIDLPINFVVYNDIPKNPKKLCPKYYVHQDVEDHLRTLKEAFFRERIQHEDVICRLFPYTLREEAYY